MDTRVSIIIPTLNEAANIGACLAPLQALRSEGHEIIVVDGDSRDRTVTLAASLADRVLHAPRGRAAQMNAGAAVAQGDVLLFLHADCQLPVHAIECIATALRGRDDRWGRFDVRIAGHHAALKVVTAMMNLRSRLTGIATGDQAIFVTRALFERVGGFPEQPLMEDIEVSRRLRQLAWPICVRDRVVTSARRWEKHGPWRTVLLMWRLRWAYYRGVDPASLARRYVPHSLE